MRNRRVTAGLTLIVLGLGFYFLQRFRGIGDATFFFIFGSLFLAAYLYKRTSGLLVPAGVLMGLGLGSIPNGPLGFFGGDPEKLGLGLGFISIYVIMLLYEGKSHWWPLIPGVALILIGLPNGDRVFRLLFGNWPLILVMIGVLILVATFRRGAPKSED